MGYFLKENCTAGHKIHTPRRPTHWNFLNGKTIPDKATDIRFGMYLQELEIHTTDFYRTSIQLNYIGLDLQNQKVKVESMLARSGI